jgi:hypothetical protein
MIDALDAGDGERLAAVLRGHLDHKRATVLAQLDAGATPPPAVRGADGGRAEDSR